MADKGIECHFYRIDLDSGEIPEKLLCRKNSMENLPWHLLIGENENRRILDIGCGIGLSNLSLAKQYKEVYACDLASENGQLLDKGVEYNSVKNVRYSHCFYSPKFPFKNNYFDVVLVNGVLQHIFNEPKAIFKDDNLLNYKFFRLFNAIVGNIRPNNSQIRFLMEINRVLKSDGTLFIGIENRLSKNSFIGALENHLLLKYITLLPRTIANIYEFLFNRKPYLNYTYSLWGYRKLLTRSGFLLHRFYGLAPNYSTVREIVDAEYFIKAATKSRVTGIKHLIRDRIENLKTTQKYLPHCFGIVVKKTGKLQNSIERIVSELNSLNGSSKYIISNHKYVSTEKGTVVIQLCDPFQDVKFALKIGLNPTTVEQLSMNYGALSSIHTSSDIGSEIKSLVPKPISRATFKGYNYFVEEYMEGKPSAQLWNNADDMRSILKQASNLIIELHLASKSKGSLSCIEQETSIGKKIQNLRKLLIFEKQKGIDKIENYLKDNLISQNCFSVFHKGDFSANNLFVSDNNTVNAIIDWDQFNLRGYPLVDLLNLIESFKRNFLKLGMGRILIDYFFTNSFDKYEKEIIDHYCDQLKLPKKLVFPLSIIYWLEHINGQNFNNIKNNKRWITHNATDVLCYLDRVL